MTIYLYVMHVEQQFKIKQIFGCGIYLFFAAYMKDAYSPDQYFGLWYRQTGAIANGFAYAWFIEYDSRLTTIQSHYNEALCFISEISSYLWYYESLKHHWLWKVKS